MFSGKVSFSGCLGVQGGANGKLVSCKLEGQAKILMMNFDSLQS